MGLLDLFSKKSGGGALRKHASRVANKRAQAPDRWDSIRALGQMQSADAVEALLARFTFSVDPSITDQEEKEAAFEMVVGAGEAAVEPVRRFMMEVDSIAWPLKCLDRVLPPEEVTGALLELLTGMDTEYERDPQKKVQTLAALEERRDPRIVEGARRFLDDMNETVRFHAVGALLAQGGDEEEAVRSALIDTFVGEESTRVRARILDGFVEHGWSVEGRVDEVREKLPAGYALTAKGEVKKAAR